MTRFQQITLGTVLSLFALGMILFAGSGAPTVADEDQRPGLVSTAETFEQTSTFYPSGAEYVQAVYASQGIDISTDIAADSYSAEAGPMVGDIVIGHDYVGILTDESTAVGVANDGGIAQTFRVTTEDINRVDW